MPAPCTSPLAPSHFGESTVEGIGFLFAAWLQIALAVAVLLRPTRVVIFTVIAVTAASIGAWAVSRISGMPFGEHADQAEQVTVVDGLTVVMEAFTVGLAATLLSASVRRFRLSRVRADRRSSPCSHSPRRCLAAPEARDHAAAHGDATGDANCSRARHDRRGNERGNRRGDHQCDGSLTRSATSTSGSTAGQITDLNGRVVKGVKALDVAHEEEPDQLLDAPTRALFASQLSAAARGCTGVPDRRRCSSRAGYFFSQCVRYGPATDTHYIGFGGGTSVRRRRAAADAHL